MAAHNTRIWTIALEVPLVIKRRVILHGRYNREISRHCSLRVFHCREIISFSSCTPAEAYLALRKDVESRESVFPAACRKTVSRIIAKRDFGVAPSVCACESSRQKYAAAARKYANFPCIKVKPPFYFISYTRVQLVTALLYANYSPAI